MAKGADRSQITIKAVVEYAAILRDRAARARMKDPYAQAYAPSEDVARRLCSELGPEGARRALAEKAVAHGLRVAEQNARATRSHAEHRDRQVALKREREARLAKMSVGQRLDAALLTISVFSETPAARLDGARITGSKTADRVWSGRRRLERDKILAEAKSLILRAERLVESTRRRLVEEERAA